VFCSVHCKARFGYHTRNLRRRKGRRFLNLMGNQYGALKVIAHAGVNERSDRLWRVDCSLCNKTKVMTAGVLRANRFKSCGCARYRKQGSRLKTLYFIEKQLGPEAMVGFELIVQMDHPETIFKNAQGSLPVPPDQSRPDA
jgi:hypothetical protein